MRFQFRAIAVFSSAVALSACSPAMEQASSRKVETAVFATVTAAVKPGYIDCFGKPQQEPASLSLDCVSDKMRVENITWESWDETGGRGTGELVQPKLKPKKVSVELTSPVGDSFTDLYVDKVLMYP